MAVDMRTLPALEPVTMFQKSLGVPCSKRGTLMFMPMIPVMAMNMLITKHETVSTTFIFSKWF